MIYHHQEFDIMGVSRPAIAVLSMLQFVNYVFEVYL